MKYVARMMTLALTVLPLLAVAQLGSTQQIVANVPFSFTVGSKNVPAGRYTLQPVTLDKNTFAIHNPAAKVGLLSSALPAETAQAAANYALVFHKYGEAYFLAGIKLAHSRTMYRMPQSKAEAEILAHNGPFREEILRASLQ
jgi:hypothetical protein